MQPDLSVVITIFNEAPTLTELCTRLTTVLEGLGRRYEVILVEGGSRDDSYARLRDIAAHDPHFKVVRLSRNFGHHTSITAGLDFAQGEAVVVMDGDLQHRPEDIPRFLQMLEDGGFDVVVGRRSTHAIPPFKRWTSKLFNRVMRTILREQVDIDSNIYRIMRRKVVLAFLECRERSRFITGLFGWVGFKRGDIDIQLDPRRAGRSHYNLSRMMRLALDSITAFSYFPLEVSTYLGFAMAILSIIYSFDLAWTKILYNVPVEGWTTLACAIFFVGGVQMMMLGVIGAYLGRIYTEVQRRPLYVVDETLNVEAAATFDRTSRPPRYEVPASPKE